MTEAQCWEQGAHSGHRDTGTPGFYSSHSSRCGHKQVATTAPSISMTRTETGSCSVGGSGLGKRSAWQQPRRGQRARSQAQARRQAASGSSVQAGQRRGHRSKAWGPGSVWPGPERLAGFRPKPRAKPWLSERGARSDAEGQAAHPPLSGQDSRNSPARAPQEGQSWGGHGVLKTGSGETPGSEAQELRGWP